MDNDDFAESPLFAWPGMKAAAVACALLSVKCALTSMLTGLARVLNIDAVTPEDTMIAPDKFSPQLRRDNAIVERLNRVLQNDVENIPHFMVICALYGLALGPEPPPSRLSEAETLFMTYVAGRYLHTFFYVLAVQPYRTISFAAAAASAFFTAGRLLGWALEDRIGKRYADVLPFALLAPEAIQLSYFCITIPEFVVSFVRPVSARKKKE